MSICPLDAVQAVAIARLMRDYSLLLNANLVDCQRLCNHRSPSSAVGGRTLSQVGAEAETEIEGPDSWYVQLAHSHLADEENQIAIEPADIASLVAVARCRIRSHGQ